MEIQNYDPGPMEKAGIDKEIIAAHKESLISEFELISADIYEYEQIKSGSVKNFVANSLRDLPKILIKARISQGKTQRDLAEDIGVKEQQIQRYEATFYKGASLERLIEVADALDVEIVEAAIGKDARRGPKDRTSIDWSPYPFTEMLKRGWFDDVIGGIEKEKDRRDDLMFDFFREVGAIDSVAALHRKSFRGTSIDEYALTAWQARVLHIAQRKHVNRPFDHKLMDEKWLKELINLSNHDDGPRAVGHLLSNVGVHFVIEPHLPQTRLDGAAIKPREGNPIIAMTLRHDRIDNFWFTLLHEVGHVIQHLPTGEYEAILDDTECPSEDKIEVEADTFAQETLIASAQWKRCVSRFSRTEKAVLNDANKIGINPAIVAGRIRRESGNYTILGELVGQGKVRKLFPDINFY